MIHLYVYVDGSDLADVEGELLPAFEAFARTWQVESARVINDRYERTPDLRPEDLPAWNLGLNLEFDRLPRRRFEELIAFLAGLSEKTGREFVIGGWSPETKVSEDWWFIGADSDMESLAFIEDFCEEP